MQIIKDDAGMVVGFVAERVMTLWISLKINKV